MKLTIAVLILVLTSNVWAARESSIFSQDSEYIYRSIPDTINVTDVELMTKLITAATQESLKQTKNILDVLEVNEFDSALEQVEADITSYMKIDEQLEAINKQIATFADSQKGKKWSVADMLPKSLTIYAGFSGSAAFLASFSGSAVVGYNIIMDKVDRISKKDLHRFLKNKNELSLEDIKNVFSDVEAGFIEPNTYFIFDTKRTIKNANGDSLTVTTGYIPDMAPVIIASPSVGVGVGAGATLRLGLGVSWWKGDKVLEPEDLYGWGIAYSQDLGAIAGGYNLKLGAVNSDAVNGYSDYLYGSFAFTVGPQAEFSPAKASLMVFKDPTWALTKLGIDKKVENWIEKEIDGSSRALWDKLVNERNDLKVTPQNKAFNKPTPQIPSK